MKFNLVVFTAGTKVTLQKGCLQDTELTRKLLGPIKRMKIDKKHVYFQPTGYSEINQIWREVDFSKESLNVIIKELT